MDISAILLTIVSSILWGCFDGVRKHLVKKIDLWSLLFYLSFFFSIIFLIFVLVKGSFVVSSHYLFYGFVTVILNFLANYFYIKAIEISDISSSVPFLAFTSLFTTVSAFLILGETLSGMQIFGMILVVTSSFFVNHRTKQNFRTLIIDNKGAFFMIGVSLLWALSAPFDKLAVSHANVISHSLIQSFFITLINLYIVLKVKKRNLLKDFFHCPKILAGGSLIAAMALGLQFYCYTFMNVSIFEALKRGIAIITAFVISYFFFKEKISITKIIATLIIIMGVILIVLN